MRVVMARNRAEYIPALKYDWLTPLYDPLLRWTIRESTFKNHLMQQAWIESGHRVLDLGCGTATLTLLIKRKQSEAEVVELDGDAEESARYMTIVGTLSLYSARKPK